MTPQSLDELFDQIPSLADQPRTIEELPGGLTNLNLKVTTPRGVFVARCSRSDTSLLGIDRDAEHANTRSAELAGVLGRARAKELLTDLARRTRAENKSLAELLGEETELKDIDIDLDEIADPARYTGSAGALTDRALERP